jgi:hypothetical protein
MEVAVEPDVGRALDHVDEFLLGALGVRERRALAGLDPLVVDAELIEPKVPPIVSTPRHRLVVPGIAPGFSGFDLAPMDDRGMT